MAFKPLDFKPLDNAPISLDSTDCLDSTNDAAIANPLG
jgi:hypothetical protein